MSTHNKRKIRLPRIYQKCASRTTLEKDQIRFTLPWILVCRKYEVFVPIFLSKLLSRYSLCWDCMQ